jgi:hypothetical protein
MHLNADLSPSKDLPGVKLTDAMVAAIDWMANACGAGAA